MKKIKLIRTADCVVGGFRYGTGRPLVGSLLLGLYNEEGLLDHVGFTSTIKEKDRRQLTRKLESLKNPPGFTGDKPGGPSRWSTERSAEWQPLEPSLVAEVSYDHFIARSIPPRHPIPPLAPGQIAGAMHLRAGRPTRRNRPAASRLMRASSHPVNYSSSDTILKKNVSFLGLLMLGMTAHA